MAERKTTRQSNTEAEKHNENRLRHDKVFWSSVLFALGVLFLAFTFIKGESVWNGIHNVLLGLFGVSVFLVPAVLIYVSVMIAMDKTELYVSARVLQSMILIILLSAFVQIVCAGELQGTDFFKEILPTLYSEGKRLRGGGIISVIVAGPLLAMFKKAGATIIIVLLIFVFIMIMANKTIIDVFRMLKSAAEKAGSTIVRDDGADSSSSGAKNGPVPNNDVPAKIAKEKQKDFDIDIPMPAGQKLSPAEQLKATGTLTEPPKDDISSVIPTVQPMKKNPVIEAEKELAKEKMKQASDELGEIIRKAAAMPKKAPARECPPEEKKPARREPRIKQSSLASDRIGSDEDIELEATTAADIQNEIAENKQDAVVYNYPPISLLRAADNDSNAGDAEAEMKNNANTLVDTLKSFGVKTHIVDINRGPTVTRYELQPDAGVKVAKITALADDIALNLAAAGVRIEAPIPGKAAVGIEVPNRIKDMVSIREMIESPEFQNAQSKLAFVVGKNIDGEIIIGDISKLPHVIIAGTTGSGKSVYTNGIIMSILYNASPDEVKLVLIDPKMVEFKSYEGIPHLLIPVVTDPRKAAGALSWAVQEMLKRYKLFSDTGVRDINGYNEMAAETDGVEPLPRIVIAIDEFADLMMACSNDVEEAVCRLAQMARAAGMHLIIATQRPSVDIITGRIKANIPSRTALKVSSQVDSRTIMDTAGAEKLLGNGDMLYFPQGLAKPVRVQGCFVSTKEVEAVVEFIKSGGEVEYSAEIMEEIEKAIPVPKSEKGGDNSSDVPTGDASDDELIDRAVEVLSDAGQASVSYLQRRLKLGYARAARIMDELESLGIVGPYEGSKPRAVLVTKEMWLQRKLINNDTLSSAEPSGEEETEE